METLLTQEFITVVTLVLALAFAGTSALMHWLQIERIGRICFGALTILIGLIAFFPVGASSKPIVGELGSFFYMLAGVGTMLVGGFVLLRAAVPKRG